MVKSVSYEQTEIIKGILDLHVPGKKIDCDPTYGNGLFYKDGIEIPQYCYDINPKFSFVEKRDSRELPLEDNSINCIMFDPPFLATKGRSLEQDDDNNKINKWYTVFPNEKLLHQYYIDSMVEFNRVLKNKGILIFKCQDKVSSSTQYMSHVFIANEAVKAGFYPKDLFILTAKVRLVADWQKANQKSARKYHSYFWVFQKSNKIVKYT